MQEEAIERRNHCEPDDALRCPKDELLLARLPRKVLLARRMKVCRLHWLEGMAMQKLLEPVYKRRDVRKPAIVAEAAQQFIYT